MPVSTTNNFTAIVLAAGKGSKMRLLPQHTPKALLPVATRPMIWYSLNLLSQKGFKDVIVVVQEGDTQLMSYLQSTTYFQSDLLYSEQQNQMDEIDNGIGSVGSVGQQTERGTKYRIMTTTEDETTADCLRMVCMSIIYVFTYYFSNHMNR